MVKEQAEITERLNRFEQEMSFDFIPGVLDFIADLHRNGVKTAVVTSSNEAKMAAVYRVHPEIKTLFDRILTAEMFTASKPAPDCFCWVWRFSAQLPTPHMYSRILSTG